MQATIVMESRKLQCADSQTKERMNRIADKIFEEGPVTRESVSKALERMYLQTQIDSGLRLPELEKLISSWLDPKDSFELLALVNSMINANEPILPYVTRYLSCRLWEGEKKDKK